MSQKSTDVVEQAELRWKAVSRLVGHPESTDASPNAPAACGVRYKLVSSDSTAVDALAVLHELQVRQIELELQVEQMRVSCAELEAALQRQRQLYDSAPVGSFTVDIDTALVELNSSGAELLGAQRDLLLGHPLRGYLLPDSASRLQGLIRRVSEGQQVDACCLQLTPLDGKSRSVHATVNADPVGPLFLVAFMETGAHPSAGAGLPASWSGDTRSCS
jgi:PAS domain S-box-containing protein